MATIEFTIRCEPGEFRKTLLALFETITNPADQKPEQATATQVEIKPVDPKPDGKKAPVARKPKEDSAPTPANPTQASADDAGGALVQPVGVGAAPTTAATKEPATGGVVVALPDNIKNTASMRDLLTYLAEHGVGSMDAMVATCMSIQKDVPILAKVPKVDERVRRACEVLQLFPAPADAVEPAA